MCTPRIAPRPAVSSMSTASTRTLLAAQQARRDQLEREPARFFNREAPILLLAALKELARFVNAPVAGLAFVPNVTTAINSVLRSIPLPAGAELLVTDQEYNATRNILEYVAAERGCTVVVAQVPFPIAGPEEVLDAVLARVTARTKLAVIDHVTSQTALVFPIADLVRELSARGVRATATSRSRAGAWSLTRSASRCRVRTR